MAHRDADRVSMRNQAELATATCGVVVAHVASVRTE